MHGTEKDNRYYTYFNEVELKEKICGLESNMVTLLKKLAEEKNKLNDVLTEREAGPHDFAKIILPTKRNKPGTSCKSITNKRLEKCPYSRIILEIDPNCEIHGHIYKNKTCENKSSSHNLEESSVFSLFHNNEEQEESLSADNLYTAGDKSDSDINNFGLSKDDQIIDGEDDQADMEIYNKIYNMSINNLPVIKPADENSAKTVDDLLIQRQNEILEKICNFNAINNLFKPKIEQATKDAADSLQKNDEMVDSSFVQPLPNQQNDTKNNLELKNIMKTNDHYNYELSTLTSETEKQNSGVLDENELNSLLSAIQVNYFKSYSRDLPIDLLSDLMKYN